MKLKRNLLLLSFSLVAIAATAVPAKRGLWKTVRLTDGTEVRVQLTGDEHGHWFVDSNGNCYVSNGENVYKQADGTALAKRASLRRQAASAIQSVQMNRLRKAGSSDAITGTKKGLILLVEFKNMAFKPEHNLDFYKRFANEEGFNYGSFYGSVSDYFKAPSFGEFILDFDVVGPITLERNYSYYGGNNLSGNDLRPGQMVAEACLAADEEINFSDYDWDGDGEVEQVFVLYAGESEAEGGSANTIWPHMFSLSASDYGSVLELDGVVINTYACSNEITVNSQGDYRSSGIGALCHEFSHCLGYPDFYDTDNNGNYGLGNWDLMDHGAYNGNGYIPAGYSAYERMVAGWRMPVELRADTVVSGMKPVNEHDAEAFVVYNRAYPNEYYLFENRKKTGWDSGLPGEGLLVSYVDYSETFWRLNIVNSTADKTRFGIPLNNHRRMTIIPANNRAFSSSEAGHPYPYAGNNVLSNTSIPAATLVHPNTNGERLLNITLSDIARDSQGLISFNFKNDNTIEPTPDHLTSPENALFYESFDEANGIGGNDDIWVGEYVGVGQFKADNEGWTSSDNAAFGALRCARIGAGGTAKGWATTPAFTVNDNALFRFKTAPYGADKLTLQLNIESDNGEATISPSEFTMEAGTWSTFTATIEAQGEVRVTVSPAQRCFIDEVMAASQSELGIANFSANDAAKPADAIYSVAGVYVGTNMESLPKGIYIKGGKKVVVK